METNTFKAVTHIWIFWTKTLRFDRKLLRVLVKTSWTVTLTVLCVSCIEP